MQVLFGGMSGSIGYIRADKLRPLAVTTAMRFYGLPDVPTVGEFVPGYEASDWFGLGVPKGTPAAIVYKLNEAVNASLADAKLKMQLADQGATVFPCSPADFGQFVAAETDKWGKVVRFAGLKPD